METPFRAWVVPFLFAWLVLFARNDAFAQEPARPADPAHALFLQGWQNHSAGRLEESVRIYKELVAKYPKSNWAGCGLGIMGWDLMTLKRYDEALETFQRIMREYPESKYENGVLPADHAGYSIAHCLYARGDIDQAMAAFDEAVRKCPDVRAGDNDGNLRSELFLNMLENEDEWKATAKGPDQPADPAEEIYRRAYRSKGDAALKACLRLVTQYPKHKLAGAALANTAWALSALGFYDEAIARYRRILEEYADSQFMSGKPVAPKAAWYIACCYYEKGDMQGARKAFDFALEKYPDANVRGKTYGEIFLTLIEKVDAAVGKPGK